MDSRVSTTVSRPVGEQTQVLAVVPAAATIDQVEDSHCQLPMLIGLLLATPDQSRIRVDADLATLSHPTPVLRLVSLSTMVLNTGDSPSSRSSTAPITMSLTTTISMLAMEVIWTRSGGIRKTMVPCMMRTTSMSQEPPVLLETASTTSQRLSVSSKIGTRPHLVIQRPSPLSSRTDQSLLLSLLETIPGTFTNQE